MYLRLIIKMSMKKGASARHLPTLKIFSEHRFTGRLRPYLSEMLPTVASSASGKNVFTARMKFRSLFIDMTSALYQGMSGIPTGSSFLPIFLRSI